MRKGLKIIRGLEDAIAGDISRVNIGGDVWAKVEDIHSDQKEIMRINNLLRDLGNKLAAAACDVHPTAPSSESMRRLHYAIHEWNMAVAP